MGARLERSLASFESAIAGLPGWDYVTRNKHGALPKGTPCRVERRKRNIVVHVQKKYLGITDPNSPAFGELMHHVWYTQPCWYLEGYEDPRRMKKLLDHYVKLRPL